jgi:hypothetical protein
VTNPSATAIIQIFDVALKSYFLSPASEPKLTNPEEVQEAKGVSRSARLRALKISRKGL